MRSGRKQRQFQESETAADSSCGWQVQDAAADPDAESVAEIGCSGIAHDNALEAAGETIALALKGPAPLKPIADQLIRAANSAPANLAEGRGRIGTGRMHFSRACSASAREVDSHLRLLARAGVVDSRPVAKALATFDEVPGALRAR